MACHSLLKLRRPYPRCPARPAGWPQGHRYVRVLELRGRAFCCSPGRLVRFLATSLRNKEVVAGAAPLAGKRGTSLAAVHAGARRRAGPDEPDERRDAARRGHESRPGAAGRESRHARALLRSAPGGSVPGGSVAGGYRNRAPYRVRLPGDRRLRTRRLRYTGGSVPGGSVPGGCVPGGSVSGGDWSAAGHRGAPGPGRGQAWNPLCQGRVAGCRVTSRAMRATPGTRRAARRPGPAITLAGGGNPVTEPVPSRRTDRPSARAPDGPAARLRFRPPGRAGMTVPSGPSLRRGPGYGRPYESVRARSRRRAGRGYGTDPRYEDDGYGPDPRYGSGTRRPRSGYGGPAPGYPTGDPGHSPAAVGARQPSAMNPGKHTGPLPGFLSTAVTSDDDLQFGDAAGTCGRPGRPRPSCGSGRPG